MRSWDSIRESSSRRQRIIILYEDSCGIALHLLRMCEIYFKCRVRIMCYISDPNIFENDNLFSDPDICFKVHYGRCDVLLSLYKVILYGQGYFRCCSGLRSCICLFIVYQFIDVMWGNFRTLEHYCMLSFEVLIKFGMFPIQIQTLPDFHYFMV